MKDLFAKRGHFEIVYEILSVCLRPSKKTQILYSCNLSYEQMQKYLKMLISSDLLAVIDEQEREFFETTDKGRLFTADYEQLNELLATNAAQTKIKVKKNTY